MGDLALVFGGDLALASAGDIALAQAGALTEQRVLRRLLTNRGDYIWQISYGGGMGQFVGVAGAAAPAVSVARAQMAQEARVAQTPLPQIGASTDVASGVVLTISYQDATTGQPTLLSLPA